MLPLVIIIVVMFRTLQVIFLHTLEQNSMQLPLELFILIALEPIILVIIMKVVWVILDLTQVVRVTPTGIVEQFLLLVLI